MWGYFSVGANGGIHEFADSQFGHLFANGPTREIARKNLVLALKEIDVRGEIRTTVEYLVQLLETPEFKENTIDTAWLDGIIKEKSVSVPLEPHTTVVAAVLYRAIRYVQSETAALLESLGEGPALRLEHRRPQQVPGRARTEGVKYSFVVERSAENSYVLAINGQQIPATVREQPDGSLLATFGGKTRKMNGIEEPLGLRIVVDGATCLLPNIFDPSELRTDVTGKIVRYLQEDGAEVEAGEPFVEVEAMKMIMPLKATESGAIKHDLSPGSIISAGDLLGSLTLRDPSKVAKVLPFGALAIPRPRTRHTVLEKLQLFMAGYARGDAQALVQELFLDAASVDESVTALLEQYLAVEAQFVGADSLDEVVLRLVNENKDSLGTVIGIAQAHQQLKARTTLVLALLRQLVTFSDRTSAPTSRRRPRSAPRSARSPRSRARTTARSRCRRSCSRTRRPAPRSATGSPSSPRRSRARRTCRRSRSSRRSRRASTCSRRSSTRTTCSRPRSRSTCAACTARTASPA